MACLIPATLCVLREMGWDEKGKMQRQGDGAVGEQDGKGGRERAGTVKSHVKTRVLLRPLNFEQSSISHVYLTYRSIPSRVDERLG